MDYSLISAVLFLFSTIIIAIISIWLLSLKILHGTFIVVSVVDKNAEREKIE